MLGGLRRLVLAAIVAGAVLWAPTTAFACSGGPSAENVYKECIPTGSGSKPTSSAHSSGQAANSTGSTQAPVSSQTAKALAHTSKQDRRRLRHLLGLGTMRLHAPNGPTAAATEPSALGSAFDLGSGATVLLIVLAGTAVLLLGGSGMRIWRQRHRA